MPTTDNIYIFNQYYVELLKVCKSNAKSCKDRPGSRGKMARDVLRAIKKHYSSFDKLSPEHIAFFKTEVGEVAHKYLVDGVFDETTGSGGTWFQDITFEQVQAFGRDIQQNLTILGLLIEDSIDGTKVVEVSRKMADAKEFEDALDAAFGGEGDVGEGATLAKAALTRLRGFYVEEAKTKAAKIPSIPGLDGIEDTSLGKLAKEIMEDPEVQVLHASLKTAMEGGEGGGPENLMNMFGGGGDSGNNIAKLMGTVSQKMVQKLMSGEIKQETLLQDAMQFASKMGGMPGGLDLSSIGNMLSGMTGGGGAGGGGAGGFDFSSLMSAFGGAGGAGGAKKSTRPTRPQGGGAARAAAHAKRKLDARRAAAGGAATEKM